MGTRDHTVEVIEALGKPGLLVHGLPVKPGKPTILAAKRQAYYRSSGHPVSAMVIFELIVRPVISMMLQRPKEYGNKNLCKNSSKYCLSCRSAGFYKSED